MSFRLKPFRLSEKKSVTQYRIILMFKKLFVRDHNHSFYYHRIWPIYRLYFFSGIFFWYHPTTYHFRKLQLHVAHHYNCTPTARRAHTVHQNLARADIERYYRFSSIDTKHFSDFNIDSVSYIKYNNFP